MMLGSGWVVLLMAGLGVGPGKEAPGEALWYEGQEAMRQGLPLRAIACYTRSLARAPGLSRNYLSLAAAYLELGDTKHACVALGSYVACHPEDEEARAQYAELLFRRRRAVQARAEFEHCLLAAEEQGEEGLGQLIRCHSRLMDIADMLEDGYARHLHRGIGLYLLALVSRDLEETDADLSPEGLLCKAAAELTLARVERPGEARPCWYLHAVWAKLARQQPARRCLQQALQSAPFTYLTPAERRALYLACSDADKK